MQKTFATAALIALIALPAHAAKEADALPVVAKCAASFGSLAVTDGDNQGWTQYGLGSPRGLIAAIVAESGCFTMHSAASGAPATFLMSAVAGSKEDVDQTVGAVKNAAINGLARSGALSRMGGGAFGGAMGMLGGLGGKKKTVAAGLRVLSPATGMTVASGSAESSKSAITFGNAGGWGWAGNAAGGATSYTSSKDGQLLASAFIKAYNQVVGQSAALAAVPPAIAPVAAGPLPTTAVDTKLYAMPAKTAAVVRALRAGTTLSPSGKREGLFIEVKDNFGTQGWVSVEDMK